MPLPAQKFREMVFQMLYAEDFSSGDEGDAVDLMMHELKVTKKSAREAYAKAMAIRERLDDVDSRIRPASIGYQFERISRVEKNILRLGIYELCYDNRLPPKVAIAEAIRLCRKFGTPESAHFVNAVLDFVHKGSSCASKSDSKPVNL